jgi:hypothetical protein
LQSGTSKSNDIRVLIPDTGISIGEAYRYLVDWLGHQTRISGDVYRTARGISVIVRAGGHAGVSFDGGENGLGALMGPAAEAIYHQTQPFRFGVYLLNHSRLSESDSVLRDLALNGPSSERPVVS